MVKKTASRRVNLALILSLIENTMEKITEGTQVTQAFQDLKDDLKNLVTAKSRVSDIEQVVKRDKEGNIALLSCSTTNLWLPANETYFYKVTTERGGYLNADGVRLKRNSRQGEQLKLAKKSQIATEKDSLTKELIELDFTQPEATTRATELGQMLKEVDNKPLDLTALQGISDEALKEYENLMADS